MGSQRNRKTGKAAGFLRLVRPLNGLMMGFAVIVGASLVLEEPITREVAFSLLLGFVTAFALMGASMAVNDYYDREIDRINEPDRPLPSGVVRPSESLIFAGVLAAIGLTAAFLTPVGQSDLSCLAIASFSLAVSLSYATKGKRTGLPGNFLVSACVAVPFIYGSFVVGQSLSTIAVLFAALAFLSNTGREVAKGIVDIEGDRFSDIRTVAVSRGEKTAAYVASVMFLSAVGLSLLPPFLGLVSFMYVPFVAVADLGFAASSVMLVRNHSQGNAKRIKNLALLWMMFSMIAFFAGSL